MTKPGGFGRGDDARSDLGVETALGRTGLVRSGILERREASLLNPHDSNPVLRTTTKLLDALRDHQNEMAWTQIDARYRPVIAGLARRLGLDDADANEVAQQSLSEFVRVYREGKYDRTKGRLSSWILGIAQHTSLRMLRTNKRDDRGHLTSLSSVPDEPSLRSIWTDERDRAIFTRALSLLRDESAVDDRTLLAFELVALRGVPASEVASQCTMTVDQVYVAKSRVTKHLRGIVEKLTAAFEEDA